MDEIGIARDFSRCEYVPASCARKLTAEGINAQLEPLDKNGRALGPIWLWMIPHSGAADRFREERKNRKVLEDLIISTTGYDPSQLDKNELRMMLVIIVITRAEGRQRQCEFDHSLSVRAETETDEVLAIISRDPIILCPAT